ncbi:hypothetical protein HMPREF1991_03226 [Hoylesella loescheii DSM 19665 = JCM 12249 = ATCC 15930]|uniref:Uncharacterized protein n=1 Tax=Hoylesella loescheii DSM 19665 = JCM 12249 = ATCC 15930 TaxID=1122985 RepID=A0A069QCW1_HOYLO|nr:hypothetical protein HMPREF1991_03226 [Hoylesella loescheii DSM 19665 = JCM 12249 = ATCC 15930]
MIKVIKKIVIFPYISSLCMLFENYTKLYNPTSIVERNSKTKLQQ